MSKYKSYSSYGNSSWWMSDWDTNDYTTLYSPKQDKSKNLYKMAAHRRAIANFVQRNRSKQSCKIF